MNSAWRDILGSDYMDKSKTLTDMAIWPFAWTESCLIRLLKFWGIRFLTISILDFHYWNGTKWTPYSIPYVKLTFISCFKFKLLTVATVSCCSPHSDMEYVLGGWLETCNDDTGGLGPRGGIGELLMLLGTGKKKMQMMQLF